MNLPELNLNDLEIIDTAIRSLQNNLPKVVADYYEKTRQKVIEIRETKETEGLYAMYEDHNIEDN